MNRGFNFAGKRLGIVILLAGACVAQSQAPAASGHAVIWSDPGDISSKNLYWGAGGKRDQPKLPVEFLSEDSHGTNPKFDVRDANDKKWHLKMGVEARPEVAASRLLWAVGYSANENYFFKLLEVNYLPVHLRRGQQYLLHGNQVQYVRLQRLPDREKKHGNWNWRHNRFYGQREFNGLRVMMALLRNWDLKDDNNAILEENSGDQTYEVTDVGTSFGSRGKRHSSAYSKSNLKEFRKGRLISKIDGDTVDLNFPARPSPILVFEVRFYVQQLHMHWFGQHIPRADAKWIGSLLAQLSPDQIRDAFRAAGYSQSDIDAFTGILISRIQELNAL